MSEAAPKRMTVDEFLDWAAEQPGDARYELVDGFPVRLMAPESFRHGEAKAQAWLTLRRAIIEAGLPCRAFVDSVGVRIDGFSSRIPDVSVQCGPFDPSGHWLEDPVILVEIVSPSSTRRDGETKLIDYFRVSSVAHYLVIHPVERRVVHHRRQPGDQEIATRILGEGTIELSPPGFRLTVEALLGD